MCGDKDPWIRSSAISALQQNKDILGPLWQEAITNLLNQERSSFSDSHVALGMLEKRKNTLAEYPDLQKTLIRFIEIHGEGMWNNNLNQALIMLAQSKPDPKMVIPLYRKILTEPFYQEPNELRKTILQIIPDLGKEGLELLPALQQALTREEKQVKEGYSNTNSQLILLQETISKLKKIKLDNLQYVPKNIGTHE